MGEILSICVKTRGRIEGGKTPVVHVLLCPRVYVCLWRGRLQEGNVDQHKLVPPPLKGSSDYLTVMKGGVVFHVFPVLLFLALNPI